MMGMETASLASFGGGVVGTRASMIEQAKQELEMLEAQQPNRFNQLKLEIKDFISLMESHDLGTVAFGNSTSISVSSFASTQASSTRRKKRKKSSCENAKNMLPIVICLPCQENIKKTEDNDVGVSMSKFDRLACGGCNERKDRIDEVITRAQACLQKLQQFKTNFQ